MISQIFVTYMLSRVLSYTLFHLLLTVSHIVSRHFAFFDPQVMCLEVCKYWEQGGNVKISSEMVFLECRGQKDPGLALMTFYQSFFAVALRNVLNRLLRKIEREVLIGQLGKLFTWYFRAIRNPLPLCYLQILHLT